MDTARVAELPAKCPEVTTHWSHALTTMGHPERKVVGIETIDSPDPSEVYHLECGHHIL